MTANASVVAAASQALLAGYVAVILGRGAHTAARRTLARSVALVAAYSLAILVNCATADPLTYALADAFAVGFAAAALIELASFAAWCAGGGPVGVAPTLPWRLRPVGLGLSVVLLAGGVAHLTVTGRRAPGASVNLAIATAAILAAIGLFAMAARRGMRGGPGFVVACLGALAPALYDLVGEAVSIDQLTFRLVRDLGILVFVTMQLVSYASEGQEPLSLSDRIVSATLAVVLGVVVVAAHVAVPLAEPSERGSLVARLLVTLLAAMGLVIAFAPALFRSGLLRPVEELTTAFARAEAGLPAELPLRRSDELGRVAGSFNAMVRALEAGRGELERRVAEIERRKRDAEQLNEELRRQVAARSRHIADLLARQVSGPSTLVPGAVVDGRYEIEGQIGAGGMGVVFAALRLPDGRPVALKVIASATRDDALRLTREAEIAAGLDDPNLVGVLDVGVYQGAPYLVMEKLDGGALADAAHRYGDLAFVLPLLEDVARGLAALHARGVLHRDIKPANVLLTPGDRPRAKIADFGIAKNLVPEELAATAAASDGPGGGLRTRTGAIVGTLSYMAPELARGEATPAADVFAFGVMACEILGAPPFRVPPVVEARWGVATPPPRPPPAGVPVAMAACLLRALALDPGDRPTARELVAAFQGHRTAEELAAPRSAKAG